MFKARKENDYLVKLKKPYMFENKEYTQIDLSGVENLTASDLAEAEQIYTSSGQIAVVTEMSMGYACIVAAKVCSLPVEFFEKLPANEIIKVKNAVTNFFYE